MKIKALILGVLSMITVQTSALALGENVPTELLSSANWTEQEEKNVKLISDFVYDLMIKHDADLVIKKYGNGSYVQHNRNIPDGMVGIAKFIEEFTKDYPEYTYDVKRIVADGEYVVFHSHATLKKEDRGNDKKGLNITNTWRIKDGKIVEHWDSIQAIDFSMRFYSLLKGGEIRNSNGVF